jgi:Tfp pilus assembly protein PilX
MKGQHAQNPKFARGPSDKDERGVALVTTLLLLLLMTGMTVAMMYSVNSDMMINGYYRNFRGSFYAADSGLNIARQEILNQIQAAVLPTFSIGTQPIPPGTETTVTTYITSHYGSNQSITGSGQAAAAWPGKFKISSVTVNPPACTVLGGGGTCTAPTGAVTGYQYIYGYSLTAMGQSAGSESTTLVDSGSLIVNATLAASGGTTTSFAAWGMFIDKYTICDGSTLVPGTISGPVFSNGAWNFGDNGKYIFTDKVGSASSKAGYQFGNGTCNQVAGGSSKNGSTTIAPTFQSTFSLGANTVPLPANDYNQRRAVLDGVGNNAAVVTNTDLNNALRNVSKTKYPSGGTSSGVYLPYTVDGSGNNPTYSGGGIYVQGDAKVTLSTSGTYAQVYTIVQSGTTTTITVNNQTNTTTMVSGSTTLNIAGVPVQRDPSTGAVVNKATMLYVNGSITDLKGPGQGVAAIQDNTALTITAANNVAVTGDILFKSRPVTLTQNEIAGQPADTLIPGNDHGQTLGIFTATGDIQLKNGQSNGNLEIDASLATISQGGTGGLVNTGSSINTLTIVGGRIQNNIKNIGATTRNVFFDRRYAQAGFAPPWFPSTTVTVSGSETAALTSTFQRTQWQNQSSYF